MLDDFEPDESITKIGVQVHTAGVSSAGTNSDIFIELFDWPPELASFASVAAFATEIDREWTDDFEADDTYTYPLPVSYFAGRIVNDILRLRVHKGDDSGSGWALGWIALWVNDKEFYVQEKQALNPNSPIWLEDGDVWTAPNFPRKLFFSPVLERAGLPDADADVDYDVTLVARGGRKPIEWALLSPTGDAFTATPTLTPLNADATQATFSGRTIKTTTTASWSAQLRLRDADGRLSIHPLKMRVIDTLPPPTVKSFEPALGWPITPGEPSAVVVTITSGGHDFDSRRPDSTAVSFAAAAGQRVAGTVLDVISSELEVRVPSGAVTGPITVTTEFGSVSTKSFTAHPSGYRFVKGFSCVNTVTDDDASDGFPNTFAWGRYEETFGLSDMWIVVIDQAVCPNPIATIFYTLTHDFIGNGCCHGFALLSLQMAKSIIPVSAFENDGRPYPLDDALWNMTGPKRPSLGLSRWIQSRQLVMLSDEALAYFFDRIDEIPNTDGALCQMDARPALADTKIALLGGLSDPRMLAFAADCSPSSGHVVVPYGVEVLDGIERIRMYNPNKPAREGKVDDEGSFIWVKPSSGEWGHTWDDGELWDGFYMFTIPLSEYGHQTDWSVPGLDSFLELGDWLLMGCAGTDGDARITQVTDAAGVKLLDAKGVPVTGPARRPAGVRAIPLVGTRPGNRPFVAITAPGPLTFTVSPSRRRTGAGPAGPPPAGLLGFVRGADRSISVEDVERALEVRFDAGDDSVEIAPRTGVASPIVRIGRRFPERSESLSYAVRVRAVEAGAPARLQPDPDGRGVVVTALTGGRTVDVEVSHCARNGKQRVLESGGIEIPPGATARLSVTDPFALDRREARPLIVDIERADGATNRLELGDDPAGPRVVAPFRVLAPIQIDVDGGSGPDEREVAIDVSRSTGLRHRALGARSRQDGNRLLVRVERGMRPVRVVAEDSDGARSFPRTVFVSRPEEGRRDTPLPTVTAQDVTILPSATGFVALEGYFAGQRTVGLQIDFSIRDRRSGVGTARPELLDDAFELSTALQSLGATATATAKLGGMVLTLTIAWDAARPGRDELELGRLGVSVPAAVPLGSAFILTGTGTVTTLRAGKRPLNVLPTLVRSWGGPEPDSLTIAGRQAVTEDQEVELRTVVGGAAAGSPAGWWVERVSGWASIRSTEAEPGRATLRGQTAGVVRVRAVVGTTVADRLVRVRPAVKPTRLGAGSKARTSGLRRRSTRRRPTS